METKSQAKIAIRGKGSVKEGKGKSDAAHASNQYEDLHCLIMADTEEKIAKAKELIHQVIETVSQMDPFHFMQFVLIKAQAASIPEGQNELKRNQLRELAALNGTLRDDENQACQNCGEIGHRKYDCPNAKNFTAGIICRVCGNAGHFARDCTERARGSDWRNLPARGAADSTDKEYENLMNEIGGGTAGNPSRQIEYNGAGAGAAPPGGPAGDLKPWQRGPTGGPAPWEVNKQNGPSNPAPWQQRPAPSGPSGGPAPWEQRSGGYGGDREHRGGGDRGPAPWQQPRGHDRGNDNYGGYGGGHGGHGGYGGGGGGYGQGAPTGGAAPWMQPQAHAGYGAPGMDNYGAPPPPPPPPASIPPPPPPSDLPPHPPPPPQ